MTQLKPPRSDLQQEEDQKGGCDVQEDGNVLRRSAKGDAHMIRKMIAACAALALTACASGASQQQAAATELPPGPALFVVRDADSTMYLFGTIHIRRPGTPWGGPQAQAGLAEASEVWTELEISPNTEAQMQGLVGRYGLAEAGRPLSSYFSAEENTRITATAQSLGLQPQMVEAMKPWLVALTFQVMQMMQAGYDPAAGADRQIDAYADANGKTARWFETAEEQISMLAGMSPEVQRQMLLEAVDETEAGAALMERMATAWATGDLDTLEQLVVTDMRNEYPEFYEVLLADRNDRWMTVLHQELQGSGVDFVAVGAGHVVGEDGLVTQLRALGYTVERVE